MLHCVLEVEILFNSLSLFLSNIQKDIKEHAVHYPLQFGDVPSAKYIWDPIVNDVDVLAVTHQQPVELWRLEDVKHYHDMQFKCHSDAMAEFPEQFECHKNYNVEKLEELPSDY